MPPQPSLGKPTPASSPTSRFAETFKLFERLERYRIVLRRYWWVVPACLVITLGLASYFGSKLPPTYQSKAKLRMRAHAGMAEGRTSEDTSGQVELLESRTVYDAALAQLRTEHPDWDLGSTNPPPGAAPLFTLSVKEIPKAGVFELQAVGSQPIPTRAFLESLIQAYLEFRVKDRLASSDAAEGSLSQQLAATERQIDAAQEKARKYQIENQLLIYQEQGNSAAAYLARINRQLTALRSESQLIGMLNPDQVAEIASRFMDDNSAEPLPGQNVSREFLQSMAGPVADSYRASQQLVLLKAKRDELAKALRPEHPKMVRLEKMIADQEKILGVFKTESERQLQNRRAMIGLQIKSLETAYQEWEAKAAEATTKIAEYERIQQEIRRLQNVYDRLAGVVQSVGLTKNLEQETFTILDHASPAEPVNRKLKFQILGALLGLFAGFGLLYFVEQLDDRFSSVTELRALLNELVAGEIPDQPRGRNRTVSLIQPEDRRHEFVEAFAMIRSGVILNFPEQERPRILVVTSSVPQEGKSTVASNLAISLAMGGPKVLLVDADLRRATLHERFGLVRQPGLSEALQACAKTRAGNAGKRVVFSQVADLLDAKGNHLPPPQATKTPNLWVLPAGAVPENPGALFLNDSIQQLVQAFSKEYDFVVIDSAPVLVADDTSNIAPRTDGVLFVVRGSFTSARVASAALDVLRQRQSKLLGLIFNRAPRTISRPYYKYYHSKT